MWRVGNENGGRLEASPLATRWKLSNGTFGSGVDLRGRDLGRLPCSDGDNVDMNENEVEEEKNEVAVLSLCQIQLGLIGVRES
ncbi:hypothetical protein ACLKA6_010828 [Drosophila palustris]